MLLLIFIIKNIFLTYYFRLKFDNSKQVIEIKNGKVTENKS